MESTTRLPCPHCGEPIALPLGSFFPSNRYGILCPACARYSYLPWRVFLVGLLSLLIALTTGLLLLKGLGLTQTDTIPEVLWLGVLFFVVVLVSTHVSCLICRSFTRHLRR